MTTVGSIKLSDDMDTSSINAETPGSTVTIDISNPAKVRTWTAGQNETVNISGSQIAGRFIILMITNDGLLPRIITFGTGFKSSGTATGALSKVSVLIFCSDGTNFYEVGRTLAL